MAKIALIWELGAGHGHLSRLLPVALGLRERGHEPVFILRTLQHAETLLGPEHIPYTQAPVWMEPVKQRRPPLNFCETLFLFGFINPHALHTLARAWRHQLEALKPDLLVLEHAPVALLATRGLGIPRLLTGNSFAIPPRATPLPPYRWWEPPPPTDVLHESEARLTRHANAALARLGGPALGCVADLFEAEASLMTGFSPLDVYGTRGPEAFAGISRQSHRYPAPDWPDVAGKRVFVYLPASHPVLPSLLGACRT